ncbi:MAG: TolC family protein [Planctomycetaceae bacterium]|jgi:outer membrane protein TolC|nr:TolC family protein [Planctomycetaceae bacterium]
MKYLQRFTNIAVSVLFVGVCCQFGCSPQQPFYLTEKGKYQQHYIGKATKIDYPDVDVGSLPEVARTIPPLTLANPDPASIWDLKLEESVQMALKNSKVIRTLNGVGFSKGGVSGTPGTLLQSPNAVGTVYDPALIESDPRAGQEAALAAFDGQLTAAANWQKETSAAWNGFGTYGSPQQNIGNFSAGINKYASTGGQYYVTNGNRYSGTAPVQWLSYLEGGFTQPLLQGNGIEFNRIAGPGSTVGNYNGVVIARINTDTALVDFEMNTRNLVAAVETAYWNLYYAYHRLESVRSGLDAAYQTWLQTKIKADVGTVGGSAQYLAQAEHNYFTFRQQTEVAQSNLFKTENALRYIMGLTATDGRLIRPIDDPITAPIKLEWQSTFCEALLRSPELRKQKWNVKRYELELVAAKNFLMPQVDLNASYRISGAGKDLIDSNNRHNNAYGSMIYDDYSGWTVGLSAAMPFGWRKELAGVRNAQLYLAKSREVLREQELELSIQIADSFRDIDLSYQQIQTTLAGRRAANDEVLAVGAAYEAGKITLDQLLDAQKRQAEAETDYYSAVIDYNLAIMTLHYRKGSLLEYDNVCLTEGAWSPKAYFDAKRRARERDAGRYLNYGFTRPQNVSRGTYKQFQGTAASFDGTAASIVPLPQTAGQPVVPPAPKLIETQPIPTPVLPKETLRHIQPTRNNRYVEVQ